MIALLLSRTLWYTDTHGELCQVRVESTDPGELDRIERLYRRMEGRSREKESAWRNGHATFTDLEVEPETLDEAVGAGANVHGFPWDPDDEHYAFALLIGEGLIGYAPSASYTHTEEGRNGKPDVASYGNEVVKGGPCPLHNGAPLPMVACCLFCTRSGRDVAIPRPTTRDLKARQERMPAWKPPEATKLPAPLKNRLGKVLAGGLRGKR